MRFDKCLLKVDKGQKCCSADKLWLDLRVPPLGKCFWNPYASACRFFRHSLGDKACSLGGPFSSLAVSSKLYSMFTLLKLVLIYLPVWPCIDWLPVHRLSGNTRSLLEILWGDKEIIHSQPICTGDLKFNFSRDTWETFFLMSLPSSHLPTKSGFPQR